MSNQVPDWLYWILDPIGSIKNKYDDWKYYRDHPEDK